MIEILATANFNTVTAICEEALINSKFIGIVGYPGAGKTTALREYAKKNPNVIYVRATASMPAKEFFASILFKLGVEGRELGLSLFNLIQRITYLINQRDTKSLLIVDEAGKFNAKYLEFMHELRDNTENSLGIIFAGPQYFKEQIEKWKNRGVQGVPELYRRINHWEELELPTRQEVKAFCYNAGVDDENFIAQLHKSSENFAEIQNKIIEFLSLIDK